MAGLKALPQDTCLAPTSADEGRSVSMSAEVIVVLVDGRYVGFTHRERSICGFRAGPGRRWVHSEPALCAGLKERSQVK